ncbi:MAG: DUF3786 domain-containing protein [Dehalococcoidia bacterium]|nr:MAG: DUF3786 domain-containing protein [Dehalococcoidia bacterium]
MKTNDPVKHSQSKYQTGLELAFKLAKTKLASINIAEQCKKAGTSIKQVDNLKNIYLDYLGSTYVIKLPEIIITSVDAKNKPLQAREQLILIHYLINADGSVPRNEKITYKELQDGATYFPTFYKRSIKPLLGNFDKNPDKLLSAAAQVGGIKTDYGDLSVKIDALPRVSIIYVFWQGDDELLPEGNILFDSNIKGYLSAEDITVLCEIITWKLIKLSEIF